MPTVLRNGRKVPHVDEDPAEESSLPLKERRQYPPSAFLLLLYPLILAVGSLFSVLSPVASSSFSTPTDLRPNYFAGKRNLVNLYFVKIGWFWTTVAFALLQATTRPSPNLKRKHYTQALTRYALITLAWYVTTQWFFGPALIDRSFTLTGGHCEAPAAPHTPAELGASIVFPTISAASVCKRHGGRWRGGHDISGHVFLLVLSSAMLVYELYLADAHAPHPHVSAAAAAKLAHELTPEERQAVGGWESEASAQRRVYVRWFLWGVVALDAWMIMMTAIWFHTWLEKLSGLVLAAAVVWGVYFLPEVVPGWRAVVGGFR